MKKKKKRGVFVCLGIIAAMAAAAAAACLLFIHKESEPIIADESSLNDLRHKAIIMINDDDDDSDEEDESDESDEGWADALDRRIDFDYLLSLNPDIYAWLYMPNPYVDMPVVQEQTVGDTYYLRHDYAGNYSVSGALLTPAEPGGLDDAHRLIFGHNMGTWSWSMFSGLPRTFCDMSFAQDNPYVYMYYPDRVERWKVYSAASTWSSDMIYDIPYTIGSDDYGELLDNITATSLYTIGDKPESRTRTLILSTCTGDEGTQKRFYVCYVPDKIKYYGISLLGKQSS